MTKNYILFLSVIILTWMELIVQKEQVMVG